jgi:DNA polymerase III subunit epsilon
LEENLVEINGINGQLELRGNSVLIKRNGLLGKMNYGSKGSKEIQITQITDVYICKPGLFSNGYIHFILSGFNENIDGVLDAGKNENAVVFNKWQLNEFEKFKAIIDKRKKEINLPTLVICHSCNKSVIKSFKLNYHILCDECFDKANSEINIKSVVITESLYILNKTKELNTKLVLLEKIISVSSELRKNPYFNKQILEKDIETVRFNALKDYTIYQQAIRENRKRLNKSEKDNLLLKYVKQTVPYSNFIAVDIETTGLKCDYHEIIEIAAVKVVNGTAIDYFKSLVKPKKKLPKKITEITGITNENLMNEQSIDLVLPKFIEFILDYPLIAHNASFDLGFIKFQAENMNLKVTNKVVDTLSLSRKYLKEIKRDGYSYKLGDICSYIGYKPLNTHRAYDDALSAAYIYQYIKETTNYPERPEYYETDYKIEKDIFDDVL